MYIFLTTFCLPFLYTLPLDHTDTLIIQSWNSYLSLSLWGFLGSRGVLWGAPSSVQQIQANQNALACTWALLQDNENCHKKKLVLLQVNQNFHKHSGTLTGKLELSQALWHYHRHTRTLLQPHWHSYRLMRTFTSILALLQEN